jgi:hypothetical protein
VKIKLPVFSGCTVTSVVYGTSGAVKKIWIETSLPEVDLSGVEFEASADITINRLVMWDQHD